MSSQAQRNKIKFLLTQINAKSRHEHLVEYKENHIELIAKIRLSNANYSTMTVAVYTNTIIAIAKTKEELINLLKALTLYIKFNSNESIKI